MNDALAKFDMSFTPTNVVAATTWHRDVTFKPIAIGEPGILWGMTVPKDPTAQQLEAIRLKWEMDVDEMFYIGDSSIPALGLLNGFGDRAGKNTLLAPAEFGRRALAKPKQLGNELPCKWLHYFGCERFTYNKDKLLFKLCWPKLTPSPNGVYTYVGRIAPLELLKETADA